jgi:hypothetical protein
MINNKSNKKLCYIGGKMTGLPDFGYPLFYAAEPNVIKLGYTPVNPARNFDGDQTLPYEAYMHKSLRQLMDCQAIYLLDGWQDSRGAKIEYDIASALGLDIIYQTYPIEQEAEKEESILQEAERIVNGQRRSDYGHPYIQFGRLAEFWSTICGVKITRLQVGLMLVCLKISRALNKYTRDSATDGAGYWGCIELVMKEEQFQNELAELSKFTDK